MLAAATLLAAGAALCQPLSPSGLVEIAKAHEETKVVFFASWCSDCKKSLSEKQPPGTIFVAAFDEARAAEQVIKAKGVKQPCYIDDGLADHFKLKSVPAVFVFDRAGTLKSRK